MGRPVDNFCVLLPPGFRWRLRGLDPAVLHLLVLVGVQFVIEEVIAKEQAQLPERCETQIFTLTAF